MSRAISGPHTTSSASSTSNGVVTRFGRTRLKDMSLTSAWKLSSDSREKQCIDHPLGSVLAEKVLANRCRARVCGTAGCESSSSSRRAKGDRGVMGTFSPEPRARRRDDIKTAAGTSLDSRNFCTMNPPMECPMSTGSVGNFADDRCQILDVVGNRAFIERLRE